MWIEGLQSPLQKEDVNARLAKVDGYLEEKDAKLWLHDFFKENTQFAVDVLMGVELFPFQSMMIKTMMKSDYFLGILGRGSSKTFSCGIFLALYAALNQGVHIGVLSASFRQSKGIMKKILDIQKSPKAALLNQCITKVSLQNDEWNIELGRSKITALPLGQGEKLRGFRFQVMVMDELLLMPSRDRKSVV